MITSAQALNQFFALVLQNGNNSDKFLHVAAATLKLEGDGAEAHALVYIHDLLRRVKADIESLPFDDATKQQAHAYLRPFDGLMGFSQFHLDMKNARGNFLNPEHLVGLTNLHMALWGNVRTITPAKELVEIALEIRAYILEIQTLYIPDHVKRALHKRLEQVASMLENYFFYGGEAVKDELEALAGCIVFNAGSEGMEEKGFFKKASGAVQKAFKYLSATDSNLNVALSIAKKGDELLNYF
jgi:hypothetical protein